MQLQNLENVCSNISSEIIVLKSLLESLHSHGNSYLPMLTFFSDKDTRLFTVNTPAQQTFDDSLIRISEALHLYSAANCESVVISLNASIHKDDVQYSSLIVFLLSDSAAWQINLPYIIQSDNTFFWHNDLFEVNQIVEEDIHSIENLTKDMLTMFYVYTHIDHSPYTLSEVLSYLSTTGAMIVNHQNDIISFYDFSHSANPFVMKD